MLQAIRNLFKSWIAITIFGVLVVVAFLFFGIEGYFGQSNSTWVAKVGGHEISQQTFTDAFNRYIETQMNQPGNTQDAASLRSPVAKQKVLRSLVNRQLLLNANDAFGIKVPDAAVRARIASIPAFQVNGKFNSDSYLSALSRQGKSAQEFQAEVRSDLATRQLPRAIVGSAFSTQAEVAAFLRLQLQQRSFSYVDLAPPAPTAEQSKVTDSQIASYYKQHSGDFMNPERVSVDYIELNAATMSVTPDLSDKALRALYAKENSSFTSVPQWEVAHILIKLPPHPTAAQTQAALKQARQVDQLAKAPGADFAKLARQYSDDLGSKNHGGNLGWMQKGVAGPKFQAALDKLKKGGVSEPVLTPEGYHVIKLLDMRPGQVKSFAQVRGQLVEQAKQDARQNAYRSVADKLTDLIYNHPTSLQPAAKKLGLKIQTTPLFGRQGTKTGLAANPDFVKTAFSDIALVQGITPDPVKLGKNHIVVLHVAKHVAAAPKPLAEVRDQIRQAIVQQRVDTRAKTLADAAYTKLQAGATLAALAGSDGGKVQKETDIQRNNTTVDPALLGAVFKLGHPVKGGVTRALVPLAKGHYALVVLSEVKPGDPSKVPATAQDFLREQMARASGAVALSGFLDSLRKGSKIKTKPKRL